VPLNNIRMVPDDVMLLIFTYCDNADILKMTGISRLMYNNAWASLMSTFKGVGSGATMSNLRRTEIRCHAAIQRYCISTDGRTVAVHAPCINGCIVTVVDRGVVRWPECYGTVFSGGRVDHRARTQSCINQMCILRNVILIVCADGAVLTWKKQEEMSALLHVPFHGLGNAQCKIVDLCSDESYADRAFAVTSTGELWTICVDHDSSRFGGNRVLAVCSTVYSCSVQCVHDRVLIHDINGRLWYYMADASSSPLLIQLAPYTDSDPLFGCMVKGGKVVVGRTPSHIDDLTIVGPTMALPLKFCSTLPRAMVVQMGFCHRSDCLIAILECGVILVTYVGTVHKKKHAAATFQIPLSLPVCILSGVIVDTNGRLWCVDVEKEFGFTPMSRVVMRNLGSVRNGSLGVATKGDIHPMMVYT
jgi:hypothetical protein